MHSKPLAAALTSLLLIAACSGGGHKKAEPTPTPTTTTPAATPTTPAPTTDWLTGAATMSTAPLMAVKIDNAPLARPYQRGFDHAALVYEELVEGGSTRLLGVFESDRSASTEIGPIRSFRESDVELVREYGTMAVAFSGGNTGVKQIIGAAQKRHWLIDASYDAIPSAYRLGAQRRDARNFFTTPGAIVSRRPGSGPTDIGLRFGPAALGGVPVTQAVATYSGQTQVGLRYHAGSGTWSITQNGTPSVGAAPVNILIQRVVEHGSRFVDVHGKTTPYTQTVGRGSATLLRDGHRYDGTWKRNGYGATHFLDAAGHDMLLRPGATWVLLVPTNGSFKAS